jgi:hypothetical protein
VIENGKKDDACPHGGKHGRKMTMQEKAGDLSDKAVSELLEGDIIPIGLGVVVFGVKRGADGHAAPYSAARFAFAQPPGFEPGSEEDERALNEQLTEFVRDALRQCSDEIEVDTGN